MKNGVPYDLAMEMDDVERLAHSVVFASFEGHEFDWSAMQYRERK